MHAGHPMYRVGGVPGVVQAGGYYGRGTTQRGYGIARAQPMARLPYAGSRLPYSGSRLPYSGSRLQDSAPDSRIQLQDSAPDSRIQLQDPVYSLQEPVYSLQEPVYSLQKPVTLEIFMDPYGRLTRNILNIPYSGILETCIQSPMVQKAGAQTSMNK